MVIVTDKNDGNNNNCEISYTGILWKRDIFWGCYCTLKISYRCNPSKYLPTRWIPFCFNLSQVPTSAG